METINALVPADIVGATKRTEHEGWTEWNVNTKQVRITIVKPFDSPWFGWAGFEGFDNGDSEHFFSGKASSLTAAEWAAYDALTGLKVGQRR